MSELCLSCKTILYNGQCYTCLKERLSLMIDAFDMFDSKLFPMTSERKSLILKIIDYEMQEIKEQLEFINEQRSDY